MLKVKVYNVAQLEEILAHVLRVCYFCGKPIVKLERRDVDSLCVHHLNGDHDDDRPENKVYGHVGCHASYHATGSRGSLYGKKLSSEHLKALVEGKQNWWDSLSEEERNKRIFESRRKGWEKWWNSLSKEEKSRIQFRRSAGLKRKNGRFLPKEEYPAELKE